MKPPRKCRAAQPRGRFDRPGGADFARSARWRGEAVASARNSRRSPQSRAIAVTGALTQVFDRLGGAKFETVLIDEAAQASELANLQAVAFGCKRCAVKRSIC